MTLAEIVEARSLTELEASIKGHMATMVRGTLEAAEARLAMGHDLLEARRQFPNNRALGRWCEEAFGKELKTKQWRWTLMQAAENEEAVRAAWSSQLDQGREINFEKAVKQAVPRTATKRAWPAPAIPEIPTGTFVTIVADPPWDYDNKATRGAADNHYDTQTLDWLEELPTELAGDGLHFADEAHLYLWVTNAFIRAGVDILEAWGFTYKTVLTWCKPSIGLGNYFRNNTEHVLFGVRGGLHTRVDDVGTWFEAPKKKHSAKPEVFFDLVEQASPGPYLEMFARRRRMGWDVWGAEA